jgi:hypothetical protein
VHHALAVKDGQGITEGGEAAKGGDAICAKAGEGGMVTFERQAGVLEEQIAQLHLGDESGPRQARESRLLPA